MANRLFPKAAAGLAGIKNYGYTFIPIVWGIDGNEPPGELEVVETPLKVEVRKFAGTGPLQDLFIPWIVPSDAVPQTGDAALGFQFRVSCVVTEDVPLSDDGFAFRLFAAIANDKSVIPNDFVFVIDSSIAEISCEQYTFLHTNWSTPFKYSGYKPNSLAMLSLSRMHSFEVDTYEHEIGVIGVGIKYLRFLEVG